MLSVLSALSERSRCFGTSYASHLLSPPTKPDMLTELVKEIEGVFGPSRLSLPAVGSDKRSLVRSFRKDM